MISADHFDQETYNNISILIEAFETAALESETREGIIMSMQGPIEGFKSILEGADLSLKKMKNIGNPPTYASKTTGGTSSPTGFSDDDEEDRRIEREWTESSADGFSVNADDAIPMASYEVGGGSFNAQTDYASLFGVPQGEADKFVSYMNECWNCNARLTFNWQIPLVDLLAPIFSLLNDINKILEELEELTNPVNFLRNFCRWMNWFSLICPADWIALLMALKMLFTKYLMFSLKVKLDWTVLLGPIINFIVDALATLIQQIAGIVLNPMECLEGVLNTLMQLEFAAKDTYSTMKATKEEFVERLKELKNGEIVPNAALSFITTGLYWDPTAKKFLRTDYGKDNFGVSIAEQKNINPWAMFASGAEFESVRTMKEAIERPQTEDLFFNKFVGAVKEAKDTVANFFNEIIFALKSIKGLVTGGLGIQMESYGFMLLILSMIRLVIMIVTLLKENQGVTDWCEFIEENPDKLDDVLKRFVDPNSSAKEGMITISGHTLPLAQCISSRDSQESVMLSKWISELTENKQ